MNVYNNNKKEEIFCGKRNASTPLGIEQSKGPGFDTQRSGSVPFFTENFFILY